MLMLMSLVLCLSHKCEHYFFFNQGNPGRPDNLFSSKYYDWPTWGNQIDQMTERKPKEEG